MLTLKAGGVDDARSSRQLTQNRLKEGDKKRQKPGFKK